ncbi:shikimate dehydrogenase [Pelagibacterium sp.]|uniref:shikimate dehydrogenase n=1 Tax=Pelagibacterium sp. TaxID=1967288 RepID=UPI003A8D1FDE
MTNLGNGLAELLDIGAKGAIHIGLLGRGIGASLSPTMHRQEGERQGIDYHYHLIDFDALHLGNENLGDIVDLLEKVGFRGVNVTHPFKQAVLDHLNQLAPDASEIGAVNTVIFDGGQRIGHNTDCWGFAESFRLGLPDSPRKHVLQIGAGGAGAAVARALIEVGVKSLSVLDTDAIRSQALAARMQDMGYSVNALTEIGALTGFDGIVNATPIGMDKYPGTPVAPKLLNAGQWVADIIYFPRETELVRRAALIGCATLPGTGMAIFQAVKAFELFTGRVPSREEMTRSFEAAA